MSFRIRLCVALAILATSISIQVVSSGNLGGLVRPGEPTAATATRLAGPADARYRVDSGQSKFMVHASAGGLLSALAHDHNIAIRNFTGEAAFTYGAVAPASLHLTIKAESLAVTDKVSQSDKQKIEGTMRDQVLEIGQYPEIVFRSTSVEASKTGEGQYQAKINGELTLHGVTHPVGFSARLEFGQDTLRAQGSFSIRQSAYNIKPVSVAGGTVKVKDELKFTFDIVAHP